MTQSTDYKEPVSILSREEITFSVEAETSHTEVFMSEVHSKPKIIDNAWETICSYPSLLKAHENARKGKRYRAEVLGFTARLEDYLLQIRDRLLEGSYELGPYRKLWVSIPKKRLVMALPYMDRIVQWAIYQYINPIFDKTMIEDSYACRIGKGSHKAVDRLQYWIRQDSRKPKPYYYLKLDISKYFYRVDHGKLIEILSKRIKDKKLMEFLETVIDDPEEKFGLPLGMKAEDVPFEDWLQDVGMPIGNLTSQLFANIYLNELDQFCKHTLKIHQYIRYMDDVVILADPKEKLHEYRRQIEKYLNEELFLNLNDKTAIRPITVPVEFVGHKITPTKKTLRKSSVKRIKKEIKIFSYSYASGRMSKEQFIRRIAAVNGIMVHADTGNLKGKLQKIFKEQSIKARSVA